MSDLFCAGGRVATLYPTPDSMKRKIDEYFEFCLREGYDRYGQPKIVEFKVPTYSGLARYLGFTSRRQMLDYAEQRDEAYGDVVKDGLLRLEDYLEGKLVYSKAPAGIALSLKNNAGWEEKSTRQLAAADTSQPLVFGWATNAKDVIDAKAESVVPPQELAEPVVTEKAEKVAVGGEKDDGIPF